MRVGVGVGVIKSQTASAIITTNKDESTFIYNIGLICSYSFAQTTITPSEESPNTHAFLIFVTPFCQITQFK